MTYNVFSGTLNPTQSINQSLRKSVAFRRKKRMTGDRKISRTQATGGEE